MTVQATHFTPEVLLSAPRRSSGIPNSTGQLVLYTVSTYSFGTHSKSSSIRVLKIEDGTSHVVCKDPEATDPVWISELEILYLKPGEHGCTMLVAQHVLDGSSPYKIRCLTASISSPKTKLLPSGKVALCCAALTTPSGDLYWPPSETKSHSTARIYSSLFVRHWDTWATENQNSLWYGQLEKEGGQWKLERPGLTNLLAGTRLVSPVPPFGGTGDFDLSTHGICFVAKDPDMNPARFTKSDLYYVPLPSFVEKATAPRQVETGHLRGYSLAPVFSRDGKQIAFTRMKNPQYESDKTRLLLVPDVNDLTVVDEFYETKDGEGGWDMKPNWILWGQDDKELFVAAEKHGRTVLWKLPSCPRDAKKTPEAVHSEGSVAEAKILGDSALILMTTKSRVESSLFAVLDPASNSVTEISSSSKKGKALGLQPSQCEEMWFPGSGGRQVHALVTMPRHFDPTKKYPLALLIHGGPQSSWLDDWSTRWNPAIFAEQGYIVVSPNPTGSTGYGQRFTDAITCNWGGDPYEDLVRCFDYLEKEVDFVDTDRAVALGASYGGYMINWIQGHELGRKFKALVCHDGVYSTQNQWSTEELFFPEHDFGGTLWESREYYDQWDPSRHVHYWATPQLVIHSECDYRLPISEGLAMFNVLQARGVPSKFLMFPDENHWVLKPENSPVWHREVLDWINKYSGIADEEKGTAEEEGDGKCAVVERWV